MEKGNDKNIEINLQLEDNISAPISAGQKVGEAKFTLNGEILSSVNVVAKDNIEQINLFTMSKRIIYKWVDLLRS